MANNDFVLGSSTIDNLSNEPRNRRGDVSGRLGDSRSSFLDGARSRPVITAAAVTAVAAAGAFLWSKRSSSSSQPLMRWGQDKSQSSGFDSASAASQFDKQAQSSFNSAYAPEVEIAPASPSSSVSESGGGSGEFKSSIDSGVSSLGGGSASGSTIDSDLISLDAKV